MVSVGGAMSVEEVGPPITLPFLWVAFHIARFENQRWTRYRRQGSSEANELFVDMTRHITWTFNFPFLAASALEVDLRS
jgi:hypothetical protein